MAVATGLDMERAGANARDFLRIIAALMAVCILLVAAFLVYTRIAG